jgi:hypothetical protein
MGRAGDGGVRCAGVCVEFYGVVRPCVRCNRKRAGEIEREISMKLKRTPKLKTPTPTLHLPTLRLRRTRSD